MQLPSIIFGRPTIERILSKGQHVPASSGKGALPVDAREALQWFVNNFGLYIGSSRGLFISDWGDAQAATLEAAIINLKSRGFAPLAVTGDTLYKQADYLWKESRTHTQFGRPLASKLELELGGSDVVIVDNLEAPENSRHLWYLYSHLLYPRAVAGKATIITTPLTFPEFVRYGDSCPDPDFCGKGINWEKLLWLMEASMISLDTFKLAREESLPPMLKAEYFLYSALKERGLNVVPQHVLGDFMLDFALFDKDRKLNIECDTLSAVGGSEVQRQDAKRNLVLLSDSWQVLKFTTAEVIGSKGACADVVDDVWRSGRKRGSIGRLLTGNTVAPMPDLPVDDDVQLAAITYGGGPAAVTGGAGTGKTTCIVQRVAYLLGQGVNPDNILVLTYAAETQKALKRTIEQVVEKQAFQRLTITSWYDFGLKVLKEHLPAIKRKPPLKVESSPQKIIQRLLAKVKKEIDPAKLELSVDLDEFYISAVISMYKSHLITPKQAKDEATTYGEEIIAKIYQALEDQLQKANRVDRDDVVSMTVQVMLDSEEVRSRYQRQFEFVLVDEYQDVTVAQDMLARLLSAPQDNLFVVGDEDETIAESKNACPELFTEWSLRSPHARCYILERNWRSHPAIVDHARQLLVGLTKRRIVKEFVSAWGQAPASAIIGPTVVNDEHEEATWVANEIQLLVDSGRSFGDIAILYRHHAYAAILEEALNEKGVRYQASNPIVNFVPDEVADMMAFLKLVMDPDGPRARESFERICQLRSREIDPKLSATIASFAEANNLSYLKAVEIYSEATADQSCRELEQLVRIIRTMHQEKLPPAETIALIRRTQRLNDYYKSIKIPPGVNYEPLKKLTQLEEESRNFKTISEFIKHVSNQQQNGNGVADTGVQVLPILDCRGLEFPIVFMVGMSEGIFPAQTTIDLEEERRICYVGFTRAKDLLYLSYPVMFSGAMLQPSHFLVDARLMVAPPPMQQQPIYEQPVFQQQPEQVYQDYAYQQQAEPVYDQQPVYQQQPEPVYQQPVYQQQPEPVYQQPVYQQQPEPVYHQQPVQQQLPEPVYQQPVQQQLPEPVYQQPVQQQLPEPVYQQPVQQQLPEPAQAAPSGQYHDHAAVPYGQPSHAAGSFEIYTAPDAQQYRPSMPSLPRSKGVGAPVPPSVVPVEQPKRAPIADPLIARTLPTSRVPAAAADVAVPSGQPAWDINQAWQVPSAQEPQLNSSVVTPPVELPQVQSSQPRQQPPLPQHLQAQPQHPQQPQPQQPQYQQPQQPQQAFVPQHAYPTQHAPVEHQAESGQPMCPQCHNHLEANARFCGGCGYTLPERVPACPTCGAPLESTAKFCGECGMSLVAPVASNSALLGDNLRRMQDLKDQQQGWVSKLFKILET